MQQKLIQQSPGSNQQVRFGNLDIFEIKVVTKANIRFDASSPFEPKCIPIKQSFIVSSFSYLDCIFKCAKCRASRSDESASKSNDNDHKQSPTNTTTNASNTTHPIGKNGIFF